MKTSRAETSIYKTPKLTVIGDLRSLTLGNHFSCTDGLSGNDGNKSNNSGECQP